MIDARAILHGIPVYFNASCLSTTTEPVRWYRRRKWQTAAQAARVQKKWIKRWGYKSQPCIFSTGDPPTAIYAHPAFKQQIEALGRMAQ